MPTSDLLRVSDAMPEKMTGLAWLGIKEDFLGLNSLARLITLLVALAYSNSLSGIRESGQLVLCRMKFLPLTK